MLDRRGLSKTYPNGTHALSRHQPDGGAGEIVAIVGGSGCGKTTLLRLVAGLDQAGEGRIVVDGADDHRAASRRRHRLPGTAAAALAHRRRQRRLRHRRPAARRAQERGSPTRWPASVSPITPAAGRASSRAGRSSASRSPARWWPARGCCCSTSRSPRSTRSPAPTCTSTCSTLWADEPADGGRSSPTTSTRRCCWPTASSSCGPRPGRLYETIDRPLPTARATSSRSAFDKAKRRVLTRLTARSRRRRRAARRRPTPAPRTGGRPQRRLRDKHPSRQPSRRRPWTPTRCAPCRPRSRTSTRRPRRGGDHPEGQGRDRRQQDRLQGRDRPRHRGGRPASGDRRHRHGAVLGRHAARGAGRLRRRDAEGGRDRARHSAGSADVRAEGDLDFRGTLGVDQGRPGRLPRDPPRLRRRHRRAAGEDRPRC